MSAKVSQHVARKDYPNFGVAKGDTYYGWSLPMGGTFRAYKSKTMPKPRQLTTSEFQISRLDLEDRINALSTDMSFDDIRSEVESIAEDIKSLGEEQTEKFDNMPEGLQSGPSGELLEGRASACEEWAEGLEEVDTDGDDDDIRNEYCESLGEPRELTDEDEESIAANIEDRKREIINEIQACSYNGD